MTPAETQRRLAAERETLQVIGSVTKAIAAQRARAGERPFVGCFKHGGLGDVMQLAAFAHAVRRARPDAYIVLVCRDLGPDADGQPLVNNILRGDGAIDHTISYPAQNWQRCVRAFYTEFDVFYEVQYCVSTYDWLDPAAHHHAQLRLQPYHNYATGFPRSNHWLDDTAMTQWELLAQTSGLDVSDEDLHIQVGTLPAELRRKKFVCIHNAAGGAALIKCAALATVNALAAALRKRRVRVLQVGAAGDPPIREALDYRGLAINDTAAVIRQAKLLIDVEGGLGYVARAVGTRRAVFFGPTPPSVFKFKGDIILSSFRCRPCWWYEDGWSVNCRRRLPLCENIPTDGERLAEVVLEKLKGAKR